MTKRTSGCDHRRAAAVAPRRRGVALMEVIIGGVIMAIGLGTIMSLVSRSMTQQSEGERQLIASWLVDELLTMALVEGPVDYPRLFDTSGRFDPPFDEFTFEMDFADRGVDHPWEVTAAVFWPHGREFRFVQAQTLIAIRQDESLEVREPAESVDRLARWYGEDEAESENQAAAEDEAAAGKAAGGSGGSSVGR